MQYDKPRVLLIAFEVIPSPTGASATISDLLRGLSPVFEIDLLSVHAPGMPHVQKYFGARVFRVPVGKGTFLARTEKFKRAVMRQLESTPYDLVHYFSLWGSHPVLEFGAEEFKTIFHVEALESLDLKYHYPELRHDRRLSRTIQARESMGLELSDKVVAVTDTGRKYLRGLGVDDSRLELIRPGADPTLFKPPEPARKRQGIVYTGSMAPWQGLSTAIFAYGRLVARSIKVPMAIYSPTVKRWAEPLLSAAEQELVISHIEFKAPLQREKLPPHMQDRAIGIAPLSRADRNHAFGCSPLRIIEYMMSGLAVVASRLPAVEEVIEHEQDGLLFTPGDPDDLAERIAELLDDGDKRQRLARNARERACKDFSIGAFWKSWLRLYSELLDMPEPALDIPDEFYGQVKERLEEEAPGASEPDEQVVVMESEDPGFEVVELDNDSAPSVIGELDGQDKAGVSDESFDDLFKDLDAELNGVGNSSDKANPIQEENKKTYKKEGKQKSRLARRYYAKEGLLDTLLGLDESGDEND